jgi:uncharacterized Fe-S cluster-containing radical SAM superfamily protein
VTTKYLLFSKRRKLAFFDDSDYAAEVVGAVDEVGVILLVGICWRYGW